MQSYCDRDSVKKKKVCTYWSNDGGVLTRSPSASLQIKGLATKYTTVKWPIQREIDCLEILKDCERCGNA